MCILDIREVGLHGNREHVSRGLMGGVRGGVVTWEIQPMGGI